MAELRQPVTKGERSMSTTYMIGSMMLAVPLLLFFAFMIFVAIKEAPWASGIVVYILVMILLLAAGCTSTPTTNVTLEDINSTIDEMNKTIQEILPSIEEVVKGCVVKEKGIGPERTLVLCRI